LTNFVLRNDDSLFNNEIVSLFSLHGYEVGCVGALPPHNPHSSSAARLYE